MSVIRGDDQQGFVPVAVGFNPVRDRLDRSVTAIDGSDRIVDVVVVVCPVDITGFDHQPEIRLTRSHHCKSCGRHFRQRRIFQKISFCVNFRIRLLDAFDRFEIAVCCLVRNVALVRSESIVAEQSVSSGCRVSSRSLKLLTAVFSLLTSRNDVLATILYGDRFQITVRQMQVPGLEIVTLSS